MVRFQSPLVYIAKSEYYIWFILSFYRKESQVKGKFDECRNEYDMKYELYTRKQAVATIQEHTAMLRVTSSQAICNILS